MKKRFAVILLLIAFGALVYTGCTSESENYVVESEGYGSAPSQDVKTLYCLGCHEGSYDALADSTIDLHGEDGWLNPHRSAHGTNIPCLTCHAKDGEGLVDTTGTSCNDPDVVRPVTCSGYCHTQDTLPNPYPNYKSSGPLSGVSL